MLDGKPYFNPATATLIKFKPNKAKIIGLVAIISVAVTKTTGFFWS